MNTIPRSMKFLTVHGVVKGQLPSHEGETSPGMGNQAQAGEVSAHKQPQSFKNFT